MKKKTQVNYILCCVFMVFISNKATAEITVDKSQGQLTITSDISGLVIVKVIGPDDLVLVDDRYQGNSFNWSPSSGPDGAYRYDVRIVEESNSDSQETKKEDNNLSDYASGSIEVVNGIIPTIEEESEEEEVQ